MNQKLLEEYKNNCATISTGSLDLILQIEQTRGKIKSDSDADVVLNMLQFTQLAGVDTILIQKGLLSHESKPELIFFQRLACLHTIEFIEDMLHLLGTNFKNALQSFGASAEDIALLIPQRKLLQEILKENERFFREVRNMCTAHKDHQASKQLSILNKLDPKSILNVVAKLMDWINQFNAFMVQLVRKLTEAKK